MRHIHIILVCMAAFALCACVGSTMQGMSGTTFVSKTGPAVSVAVPQLPLRTAGQILPSVSNRVNLGGVTVPTWIAVYGGSTLEQPMAVVAQSELSGEFFWDADMYRTFSTGQGVVLLGDMAFQACTFIDDNKNAFVGLIPDATAVPRRWLVRRMAARSNVDANKLTLEYRELLPDDMGSMSDLEAGGTYLRTFAKRAEQAFVLTRLTDKSVVLHNAYPTGLATQYLDTNFFGTMSRRDPLGQ